MSYPLITNAHINPSREHAFQAVGKKIRYRFFFCGTEWLLATDSSCVIQFTKEVEDVIENYHVPYLQSVLGRDVAKRIYTQEPIIDVKSGMDFMATMMRTAILPPNLVNDPVYARCAQLVDRIRTKNGCYMYAQEVGLAHKMCPTVLYRGGVLPEDLPFEGINWVKFSEEKKGIDTVLKIDSNNPKWREIVYAFLRQSSDDFQIQKNFKGQMRSPHFEVTLDEIIPTINPISRINLVTNHHEGSYFPEFNGMEPTTEHPMEFLKQLQIDGFFGFVNPDVLINEGGVTNSNEKNYRPGGSEFPDRLRKQQGHSTGIYGREEEVHVSLSHADVYEIVKEEGGYVYLPGNLANDVPELRTVGIYFGGENCKEDFARTQSRLKMAA